MITYTIAVDENKIPLQGAGNSSSRSVTTQNQFSTGAKLRGNYNISISGTFVATLFIQRSLDDITYTDIESFTSPVETQGYEQQSDIYYRIGCKTGGYTSGTAVVRLSQ